MTDWSIQFAGMRRDSVMTSRVFLLRSYRSWILEAIVVEASKAIKEKVSIAYIPEVKRDFFSRDFAKFIYAFLRWRGKSILVLNQSTLFRLFKLGFPVKTLNQIRVFYTHDSEKFLDFQKQSAILNQVRKIYLFNKRSMEQLISQGIYPELLEVVYGAVDRKVFFPSSSLKASIGKKDKEPYVLVTGDCKPRKAPELIFKVAEMMPDLTFVIHGNGWNELLSARDIPNIKLINFRFENQATLMRNASVFLTLSELEGGPYPTLEALASGTPVVATDTGWNRELVNQSNGRVLPIHPNLCLVVKSIEECLMMKPLVQSRDLLDGRLNWKDLGLKLFS